MSKRTRRSDDERRSQIELSHLWGDAKRVDKIRDKKTEIEEHLQDLFYLVDRSQITDGDLGIGPEASSFVEKVTNDFFCDRFYNTVVKGQLPIPPSLSVASVVKNISTLTFEQRNQEIVQSVIRDSFEATSGKKTVEPGAISLSDTFHSYSTTRLALKLLSRETTDMEEARKVFMIGWGHDIGKNEAVLNAYGFRNPFDWVKDDSVKKWMKENLNPPPKRLDERDGKGNLRIPHFIVSAELVRPALSNLGLRSEAIAEIYQGILYHDYAWMVLDGVQPLGRPEYRSGVEGHDGDKLERLIEILIETPLYAVQKRIPIERMTEVARKNYRLFLGSNGFLQPDLNHPKLKQKFTTYAEYSLQYLQRSLELHRISAKLA